MFCCHRHAALVFLVCNEECLGGNQPQFATIFDVAFEAARKRLDRFRGKNHIGWIENTDRTSKEPQYVYQLKAVRYLFEDVDLSGECPDEKR